MAGHSKWNNIKHRKGAQDKKKGKIFTKLGRELTMAAKEGGGDIEFNPRLRLAVEKAKAANMPKENLERAVKKGTGELEGSEFFEIRYEGYGPEGTAFIVDAVTDNKNRTAGEVRAAFTKKNGNLGTDGAVSWMFKKKGVISVPVGNLDFDEVMLDCLEVGAEDLIMEDEFFQIMTEPNKLGEVLKLLEKNYKCEEAEVAMIPDNKVMITDLEMAKKVLILFDALDDLDDVQEVYSNFEISDEILEQM